MVVDMVSRGVWLLLVGLALLCVQPCSPHLLSMGKVASMRVDQSEMWVVVEEMSPKPQNFVGMTGEELVELETENGEPFGSYGLPVSLECELCELMVLVAHTYLPTSSFKKPDLLMAMLHACASPHFKSFQHFSRFHARAFSFRKFKGAKPLRSDFRGLCMSMLDREGYFMSELLFDGYEKQPFHNVLFPTAACGYVEICNSTQSTNIAQELFETKIGELDADREGRELPPSPRDELIASMKPEKEAPAGEEHAFLEGTGNGGGGGGGSGGGGGGVMAHNHQDGETPKRISKRKKKHAIDSLAPTHPSTHHNAGYENGNHKAVTNGVKSSTLEQSATPQTRPSTHAEAQDTRTHAQAHRQTQATSSHVQKRQPPQSQATQAHANRNAMDAKFHSLLFNMG